MGRFKAHLALLTCNTIWALGYPIYSVLMPRYISPLALITLSMVATMIIAQGDYLRELLLSKVRGRPINPSPKIEKGDWGWILFAALLVAGLRKCSLIYGLSMTSAVDGSLIAALSPVVVLLISVLSGRERFSVPKVLGVLLALTGAVAIVATSDSAHHSSSSLLGNLLMVLLVISTGLYIVLLRGIFNKYGSAHILRLIYTIAALVLLPIGFEAVMSTSFGALGWHEWLLLCFVVVVPTYIPNLMLNYGLKSVNSTVASTYGYAQPIIAIIVSVSVGLEKLHVDTALFALMVLIGVAVVSRSGSAIKSH